MGRASSSIESEDDLVTENHLGSIEGSPQQINAHARNMSNKSKKDGGQQFFNRNFFSDMQIAENDIDESNSKI